MEHMGIDWDGPIACDLDSTVQVDPPDVLISEDCYDQLCTQIYPLEESPEYGIDIFNRTVHFLHNQEQ